MSRWRALAALALAALCLAACGPRAEFHIVAGSEQKSLEPLVMDFCAKQNVKCVIDYKGSLDIGQMVGSADANTIDAVWPASSLWIEMYDKQHRVKDMKSVAQSPVILGVKLSKAKELGWATGKPVEWVKIHDLPDYVYFNHSAHVNHGVGCIECHGRIDRMERVFQAKPLSMGWCLECHRDPGPHLRPKDQVTAMVDTQTSPEIAEDLVKQYGIHNVAYMTSCSTCHR